MNKRLLCTALTGACLLSGCVTSWQLSGGSVLKKRSRYGIRITPPKKWYRRQVKKTTLCTRNGLSLESIIIERWEWTDTLSNGYSLPSKVLLHQIPEIILGEFCASGRAFNLTVDENSLVPVDSFPCARTSFRYTAHNSLSMKGIMYCIPFRKYVTVLWYEAEVSHYYPLSVNDFFETANSISIYGKKYRALPGIHVNRK